MNFKGKKTKTLVHLDEKVLQPKDAVRSGLSAASNVSEAKPTETLRPDGLLKSVVGKPKVYDLKGNLLAEEENLVVLLGREYLAQLIASRACPGGGSTPHCITGVATCTDYTKYQITHFGVGDGGTTADCPPATVGPFDDDCDLQNRVIIKDPTAGGTEPDYLDEGKLKRIEVDGSIEIVTEQHTINDGNLNGGGTGATDVEAFTAIRYTMYLKPEEPQVKPFRFNEAGLFAVEYDAAGNPVTDPATGLQNYVLFARFTTLDKYLEDADGIMIEWYILV